MLTKQFSSIKSEFFYISTNTSARNFNAWGCLTKLWTTIRKVRRVEAVRVDEECPLLLADYLEKIAGDIYLTLSEFEWWKLRIHIRRYYTDRDGNLRPRKEGAALSLGQFAILVDSMYEIESRYWASEEGLSVSPFEQYVGQWKLNIDIFGNFSIWKHYYDQTKNQLDTSEQGHFFSVVVLQNSWREKSTTCWNVIQLWNMLFHATKVCIPPSRSAKYATRSTGTNRIPAKSFQSKVLRTLIDCYLYWTNFVFLGNHIQTIFIYSCRHFCGVLVYYSALYSINCVNEKLCVVEIHYVSI